MFNQLMRNVTAASPVVPDFTSVIDGSFKLRLRNMRLRKGAALKVAVTYDNQIIFKMQTMYNFRRLKHADQIGITYWASAKYDPTRTMAPVSFYALLEGPVPTLHQQAAILDGNLEAPQTAWSQEIDCLTTFVASSNAKRNVSQYVTLPSSERKSNFRARFNFETIEALWQEQEQELEQKQQEKRLHGHDYEQLRIEKSSLPSLVENEWTEVVHDENLEPSQKKSRRTRTRKATRKTVDSSKDLIEISSAASRKANVKTTKKKVLVTA
jgi:hypothetical protein